jgi:disulfide bond formation protein DsbB
MLKKLSPFFLPIAWAQSLLAMLGSLFFSEILKYPPCVLCWYQRIAIYPLALIFAIAILRGDRKVYLYALPLAVIGAIIALYHNLLYYGIVPESIAPCQAGVSCTTKFIEFFGFITIPFLSFCAFAVIIACMIGLMLTPEPKVAS